MLRLLRLNGAITQMEVRVSDDPWGGKRGKRSKRVYGYTAEDVARLSGLSAGTVEVYSREPHNAVDLTSLESVLRFVMVRHWRVADPNSPRVVS